jgi:hypothetical protein
MPNGEDDLSGYDPSWMTDGLWLRGEQADSFDEDVQRYDIYAGEDVRDTVDDVKALSRQEVNEDQPLAGEPCDFTGLDTSKTYVQTWTWDGSNWVCDLLETTACP